MLFTIEAAPFIRNLEKLVGRGSDQERGEAPLRLVACQGRIYLSGAQGATDMEAVVWEDGNCTVSPAGFMSLVKTYRYENVTIEADGQGLRIRGASVPVHSYSSWALAPDVGAALAATD